METKKVNGRILGIMAISIMWLSGGFCLLSESPIFGLLYFVITIIVLSTI